MESRYKVSRFYRSAIPGSLRPWLLLLSIFHLTSIYYSSHFKHPIRRIGLKLSKHTLTAVFDASGVLRLNICSEIFALAGKARERSRVREQEERWYRLPARKNEIREREREREKGNLFHFKEHVNPKRGAYLIYYQVPIRITRT